uniref:Dol-P-Glc:Glc(2)Man(9)GlcNAc(2)-PP-Dol alpha-1,2-glucosyltransferase n=1 Tax=Ciona savignyi TaxID=51511 RepID=H2Z277_CIOSA
YQQWDPKITTLPGMYFISVLILAPLSWFGGKSLCTVWSLRFINIMFNLVNLLISYLILKRLRRENVKPKVEDEKMKFFDLILKALLYCILPVRVFVTSHHRHNLIKSAWCSLSIGLFPLLYFYSFLYYTDPGSTTFVLLAYLACIHDHHKTAGLVSAISIVFRQTNVVWVMFMAGITVSDQLDDIEDVEKIQASPELHDKLARYAPNYIAVSFRFFAKLLAAVLRYLLAVDHLILIASLIWPYLLVLCGFGGFVYINGGIVVGDRSSHQAVLHLAQLFYFSGFALAFASPVLITKDKIARFVEMVRERSHECLLYAALSCYVLFHYSHEHPYLLADNRHYVFYLWRLFLGRSVIRYVAVPVYMFAAWSINDSLSKNCTSLWKVVYIICVSCQTAPQKLLEFRYFILPYIVFRINVKPQSKNTVWVELIIAVFVNLITVAVFLNKTFYWEDLKEPQRIMW